MANFLKSLTVAATSTAIVASSLSFALAAPPVPASLKSSAMSSLVEAQYQPQHRRPPPPPPPVAVKRKKQGLDPGAVIAGAAILGILGAAAVAANNDRPPAYRPPPPQPGYGYYGQPAYGYDMGTQDRYAMRAAADICKSGSKRHYRREFGAESYNEQIHQAVYRGGNSWEMHGSATVNGPYGRQQVGFLCVTAGSRIIQFQ